MMLAVGEDYIGWALTIDFFVRDTLDDLFKVHVIVSVGGVRFIWERFLYVVRTTQQMHGI